MLKPIESISFVVSLLEALPTVKKVTTNATEAMTARVLIRKLIHLKRISLNISETIRIHTPYKKDILYSAGSVHITAEVSAMTQIEPYTKQVIKWMSFLQANSGISGKWIN